MPAGLQNSMRTHAARESNLVVRCNVLVSETIQCYATSFRVLLSAVSIENLDSLDGFGMLDGGSLAE